MALSASSSTRNPWLGVEFRHFAALTAVAREGSFRAAAEALGYVQSAVSQQVAQLEQVVGQPLFERQPGAAPVTLTEAGRLLLAHADEITTRFSAARADLLALEGGGATGFRVGVFESAGARLLPPILGALRRDRPRARVLAAETDSDHELLRSVERGALAAAFCRAPDLDPRFASARLLSDPMALVVSATSELGLRGQPPDAADLAGQELIEHGMMAGLEPELQALGVVPRYALRCERNSAVHALVAAGAGAAILPALAVDDRDPRLVVLGLDHLLTPSLVRLVWHRGRRLPQLFDDFVEHACRIAEAVAAELGPRHGVAEAA